MFKGIIFLVFMSLSAQVNALAGWDCVPSDINIINAQFCRLKYKAQENCFKKTKSYKSDLFKLSRIDCEIYYAYHEWMLAGGDYTRRPSR